MVVDNLSFFPYGASHKIGSNMSVCLQNKEKSVSFKTMEDGQVLLYLVSCFAVPQSFVMHIPSLNSELYKIKNFLPNKVFFSFLFFLFF